MFAYLPLCLSGSDLLERAGLFDDGPLDCQALDAGRAKESVYAARVFEDEPGILGLGDGSAMADYQHVRMDTGAGIPNRLDARGGLFERQRGAGSNRAFGGQT